MWREHAAILWHNGYSPVPLQSDRTPFKSWSKLCTEVMSLDSIEKFASRYRRLGVGVAGGFSGLVPIDVDTDDKIVWDLLRGVLPSPNVMKKGSKGFTAFYRAHEAIRGQKFCLPPPDHKPIVEVLTSGVITIPPTMHPKIRRPYRWIKGSLYETRINELVLITPDHIKFMRTALDPICPMREIVEMPTTKRVVPDDKRMRKYAEGVLQGIASKLSGTRSGRNHALYAAACTVGRYVVNGVLSEREVKDSLVAASVSNRYAEKAGLIQVNNTIRSGLSISKGDGLPILIERGR